MKRTRVGVFGLCVLFLAGLGVQRAFARLMGPTTWPVDRMLLNVGRYVEEHPEAAQAHYCLGRIHTYAFVYESARLGTAGFGYSPDDLPELLEDGRMTLDDLARLVASSQWQRGDKNAPEAQLAHLHAALLSLRRALELAPEHGAFHLTMAYALERGAHLAAEVDAELALPLHPLAPLDDATQEYHGRLVRKLGQPSEAEKAFQALSEPMTLRRVLPLLNRERATSDSLRQANVARLLARAWLDRALEHYHQAFVLTYEVDREVEVVQDYWGLTSLEAGEGYLRLCEGRPELAPEEEFLSRVQEVVDELRKKPRVGDVTPLLLTLEGCRSLEELVSPERTALFDLDGDLVDEAWPWIAPETGWLVWDPEHEGEITSGRQLFGTGSGWFFFPDGYRVLDALDDDGNGELRGAELAGIAVWFDRDSDGISDRGEVVPVAALGIVALATQATERIGASLGNPCGLELADGRVLPTYDWVLERQQP